MGILNVTPDSFSDGGEFFDRDSAGGVRTEKSERQLRKLAALGVEIIDIGGESTRPNGQEIESGTEWRRIDGILEIAEKIDGICVSVDTYHIDTARNALERGANVINDVRCTWHFDDMAKVVRDFGGHLIVVHNSRNNSNFAGIGDPIAPIIEEFKEILRRAEAIDFDSSKIIFDPGIGFGKTARQNFEIFRKIDRFCSEFSNPIVCGTSRKSFLRELLWEFEGADGAAALRGATVATTVEGFRHGCEIFRVHDVQENLAALKIAQQFYER
jgi:dihydropteroate synthase